MPKVSIVVPCYNMGQYLPEALDSIRHQTFQDFEVILVDDASTDALTLSVLNALHTPRVRVLREPHRGLGGTRNRGIEEARGQYVCSLDADDRLLPQYLACTTAVLDRCPEAGFVTSYFRRFGEKTDTLRPETCGLPEMLVHCQAHSASVFRRDAWRQVSRFTDDVSGYDDWDLWISLLEAGYRGQVIPEVLFEYRVRSDSIWHGRDRRPERYGTVWSNLAARHRITYERNVVEIVGRTGRQLADLWAWVEQLEKANAWLEQQRANWEHSAVEKDRSIAELEYGKAWLERERTAWEHTAHAQEQTIHELREWIDSLTKATSWLEAQRGAWERRADGSARPPV